MTDLVLVLPTNYGWGARWATDHIWGIFQPNTATLQYWNLMQTVLQEYGLKTDIVYADPNTPYPHPTRTSTKQTDKECVRRPQQP
ncbi:MAG: hypothetical protein ACLQO7_14725 [Candidatus Bathyarchaeia archaeon]